MAGTRLMQRNSKETTVHFNHKATVSLGGMQTAEQNKKLCANYSRQLA